MKIKSLSELEQYSSQYDCISFDLFDTLIFRKELSLSAIKEASALYFLGLIKKSGGHKALSLAEVLENRTKFTVMLKNSFSEPTQEPTIERVYQAMAMACGVNALKAGDIAQKTSRFEFELDCVSLELLPGTKKLLDDLSSSKGSVFLVSDMYYSRDYILELIERLGIRQYFIEVFVSSTSKKTKASGDLFTDLVANSRHLASEILHIGDSRHSDVKMAKNAGLETVYFNSGTHDHADQHRVEQQISVLDKFANMSLYFVLQVLMRAWSEGVTKIFFLTRDATSLMRLLLHVGEQSAFLKAVLSEVQVKELAISRSSSTFMELSRSENSLDEVLFRFCWIFGGVFELKDINTYLSEALPGFTNIEIDDSLKGYQVGVNIDKEASHLKENYSQFAEQIISSALALGRLTYQYLLQEGAVGHGEVAFVDVGYTGTVTRNISDFLVKEADHTVADNTHIRLYFMASGVLLEPNIESAQPYVSLSYVLNEFHKLPEILRTNYSWFECFAKDHGRGALLGYQKNKAEKLIPVFAKTSDQKGPLDSWIASSQLTQYDTVKFLSSRSGVKNVQNYLSEMSFPSDSTIEYVEQLDHGCGLLDNQERSIIKRDVTLRHFSPGGLRSFIREDYWIAGSIRASGFGDWAIVWVGSAINWVRTSKATYRSSKKNLKTAVKALLKKSRSLK